MDPDYSSNEDNALNTKSIPVNILPATTGDAELEHPIPFEVGKGATTPVPPRTPPASEGGWRRALRIVLLVLEFAYTLFVLLVLLIRYVQYFSLNFTILSTLVLVRDPDITYTEVMKAQIMFFFYKEDLVNSTSGIEVTVQYYAESVDLNDRCKGHYEYYNTKSEASDLESQFKGNFVKAMTCIVLVAILFCAVVKLLLSRYVKEYDIPMVLKLHMKSKFAYEVTLYTLLNVVLISFAGILVPLIALDYDGNCLVSDIGYTVKGLYESYHALLICFICFMIPLLLSALYKYLDDDLKYVCFIIFWITLPAFLLVVASGHAILIITYQQTRSDLIFATILGSYIMLALSCVIAGTVTIIEWLSFLRRKEISEKANVNIRPMSSTGTRSEVSQNH